MKIIYWSDFACPYCYIGIERLKRVIREMGLSGEVEFERRSFQLRKGDSYGECPTCGQVKQRLSGMNDTHFRKKYRLTGEEAADRFEEMYRMGISEGLEIYYGTAPLCYTEDAHRLVKYAEDVGGTDLAEQLSDALFYMYLTENLDISDHRVLLGIGKAFGLEEAAVIQVLTTDVYGADVMMDCVKADILGIHVVPHFIVDGKYAMQGVQSDDVIREILGTALRGQ